MTIVGHVLKVNMNISKGDNIQWIRLYSACHVVNVFSLSSWDFVGNKIQNTITTHIYWWNLVHQRFNKYMLVFHFIAVIMKIYKFPWKFICSKTIESPPLKSYFDLLYWIKGDATCLKKIAARIYHSEN